MYVRTQREQLLQTHALLTGIYHKRQQSRACVGV